jgi:hypothetical protein
MVLDLAVRDGDHHADPVVSIHVNGKDDFVLEKEGLSPGTCQDQFRT